jgi:hypothetical protein
MAYCKECGAEIGEVRFCPECGAAMGDGTAVAPEPTPKAEKKKSSCGAILVAVGLVALGAFIINLASGSSPRDYVPAATRAPTTYEITYRVEKAARASVTYRNAQDNTEQKDIVIYPNRPWQVSYTMEYGDFAYISAQNDDNYGGVTCKILVNGKVWQEASSEGAYVIAKCSGSVGRE